MDINERLHQDNKRREAYKKKRDLDPDEEITYTYAKFPAHKRGLDVAESKYTSVMDKGINKTQSIFDQTAVFHTTQ